MIKDGNVEQWHEQTNTNAHLFVPIKERNNTEEQKASDLKRSPDIINDHLKEYRQLAEL